MRMPSGTTDQYIYFVAVDATDFSTRKTGLTGFTVYRSRDGGVAAAMTTPTINETDATNMPGVYGLLLDEDMTIGTGNDAEEMVFHITQAAMAPVTRTIELYRPKITVGNTLGVAADGDISGNVDGSVASVTGAVGSVTGNVGGNVVGSVASVTGNVGGSVASVTGNINTAAGTIQTLDALDTAQDVQHSITQSAITTVDGVVDAILADTGTDGVVISATTANQIADAILNRDMSVVSDTNARTMLNALRFLRNKWSVSGTTLTVTKEDDVTSAWTATVSTDATADPITGSDPA